MYDDKKEARRNALWHLMFPERVRPDIPKDILESPSEPCKPHGGLNEIYKLILGKKGIEVAQEKPSQEPKVEESSEVSEVIEPIKQEEEEEKEEDEEY